MARTWEPPVENFEKSNLARLIRKMGGDPGDYQAWHRQTIADPAAYVAAALDDLMFPWLNEPEAILEGWSPGEPIHTARWFRGGKANPAYHAVDYQVTSGRGQELALIWEGEDGTVRSFTFAQLQTEVGKVARALSLAGIRKGEVVAVMLPTVPEAVFLFYALLRIGAVFSPIATDMGPEQVAVRLREASVRTMVGCDGFHNRGRSKSLKGNIDQAALLYGGLERLIVLSYAGIEDLPWHEGRDVSWHDFIGVKGYAEIPHVEHLGPDDLTMLLFSSGTTGTPKGTRHTYAAWIEDLFENAYASDLQPGERSFWVTSIGWMMFPWLLAGHGLGATVVLYEGAANHPGPDRLLQVAADHHVSMFGASPGVFSLLLDAVAANPKGLADYHLASLKNLRNTGAPLTGTLFERIWDTLGIAVSGAWGGTDGCFCLGSGNPLSSRTEASMRPGPGMDVHVMTYDHEADLYRDVLPGEIGEVVVQTPAPSMTRGLQNDPDGTRFQGAYFHPKRPVPDEIIERQALGNWWFHGDLARMNADGELWIGGRADDLLVVKGINTDPTAVQDAIHDLILDSAPIACMIGDSVEMVVFYVSKAGDDSDLNEMHQAIRQRIRERISPRVMPAWSFPISEVPCTVNGKPQIRLVLQAFMGEELGDTSTLKNPEVLKEIKAAGRQVFGAGQDPGSS